MLVGGNGGKAISSAFRKERFYFVMAKVLTLFGGPLGRMIVCVICSSYV